MSQLSFRDILTDSIRYWERMRILYNLALVLIVIGCFSAYWPSSQSRLRLEFFTSVSIMALMANLLFCAAYPIDMIVQYSHLRPSWIRYRVGLFGCGLVFASLLTLTIMFKSLT